MSVANLLASVAQAPAEAAAEAPEDSESTEFSEIDTKTAESASDEGLETEEQEEDAPDAEADADEGDKLRQADYTRKTQALAEERKKLHAEIEAERENFAKKEEEFEEVYDWLQSLKNPEQAEFELERYFPQTMAALRDKWLLESQEESQLSEKERAAVRRVREMEQREKARLADEELERRRYEKQKKTQQSVTIRTQLNEWLPKAAEKYGLDADEDTFELIKNELRAPRYSGQKWGVNMVEQAAERVAKVLKRGAKPAEPPKPPPSPKGPGQKTPPGAKAKRPAPPKKDLDQGFKALRAKYGV